MNETRTEENVLWQNEVRANYVVARILFVSFGLALLAFVLTAVGFFASPRIFWQPILVAVILLFFAGGVLGVCFKGGKTWLKTAMFVTLIAGIGMMCILFSDSATALIFLPVLLSARYFSKHFTARVALINLVVFFFATYLGAIYGLPNIDCIEFPQGTVIRMGSETWMADVLPGIPYDHAHAVLNTMMYQFFPDAVIFVAFSLASYIIAGQGRELVLRQQELTAKSVQLSAELDMASNIQSSSLPDHFSGRSEFAIFASMDPAREVGGDFYDFFMIDDDHLAMIVADVSGKGVPAALFMMVSRTVIRSRAEAGINPAKILMDANDFLEDSNRENMFVTVWLGILEISSGYLTYASAGHERIAICQDKIWTLAPKGNAGVALGMYDTKEMEELPERYRIIDQTIRLAPGDGIFQYTDGVTEATDESDELFGEERMLDALKNAPDTDPNVLLPYIRNRIDDFSGDAEQYDDITMLGLLYRGKE